MPIKKSFLKCKSCGHIWKEEKIDTASIYYCPKCGMIGHVQNQFNIIESQDTIIPS